MCAFLPAPLSLSGLRELSIIHYSPLIFFPDGNTAPSLNLSFKSVIFKRAWCRSRTFFWGLTFSKPYFPSSPPPFPPTLILIFGAPPSFSTPRPLCPSILIILWLYLFFFLSLGPLAVSLTERDYVEVLMWASLLQISPICQHVAISIPDSDKCWRTNLLTVKI